MVLQSLRQKLCSPACTFSEMLLDSVTCDILGPEEPERGYGCFCFEVVRGNAAPSLGCLMAGPGGLEIWILHPV